MSLDEAHTIVSEGRAYTREHFVNDKQTYVGHTPVAVYDEAVDRLVKGVAELVHETEAIAALLREGGWDGDDVVAGVRGLIAHAEMLRLEPVSSGETETT
jgi:hypothetical protein